MNQQLEDVIAQIRALPEDRQQQAAVLLLDFLEQDDADIYLTKEQIAEIERALSDDESLATEEEVRETFARLTR